MLDGWRALSILAVLASHWLPLGPHAWGMNAAAGAAGMAIFFTLSGFLIVQLLLHDDRVVPFLIRRAARILPLAWLAILILIMASPIDWRTWAANLLFFANLPPARLMEGGHHLWSLCVEVQFYVFVALLVAVVGRRGLWLLPLVGFAVTALRVADAEPISIVTWHRVDEILAGATLSLIFTRFPPATKDVSLPSWLPLLLAAMLLAASHLDSGWIAYLRPYLTAAAIGTSLYTRPKWMSQLFNTRPALYIADISYALYVIHGMLTATWLGGGQTVGARYARRPLLVAATFALAHVSTNFYEKRWVSMARTFIRKNYPAKNARQPLQ